MDRELKNIKKAFETFQGEEREEAKKVQDELKTFQEALKKLEAERDRLIKGIREKYAILQRLETEQNKLKEEIVEKANTIK